MSAHDTNAMFDGIWFGLSCIGMCDRGDGPQYKRVLALWIAEGRPSGISKFIRKHVAEPVAAPEEFN